MYDRILIPTDGSERTEQVVEHALASADEDTTVHVLSVVDRRLFLSAEKDDQDDVLETLQAESDQAVAELTSRIEESGYEAVDVVREGIPHDEILAYAEETDVDLIVIGSHGRTGREKIVNLGSVTERVLSNAGRPVLVVDIGPEDATQLEASVAAGNPGDGDGSEGEEA